MVSVEFELPEKGNLGNLSSFDYLILNTESIGKLEKLDVTSLNTGNFKVSLSPLDYEIICMAVTGEEVDSRVHNYNDLGKEIWKTDIDGELQNQDLFWGTTQLNTSSNYHVKLERVTGQVSIELNDSEEGITIDSLYL